MVVECLDWLLAHAKVGQAAEQFSPLPDLWEQPTARGCGPLAAGKRRKQVQHGINRLVPARGKRRADHARQRYKVDVLEIDSRALKYGLNRLPRNAGIVFN